MEERKRLPLKPSNDDFIFAEENAKWLKTPSPFDSLDDDWKSIIVFYVFHVPVADLSARAKPLESFGWGRKSDKDDFKKLKSRLIKYGNMTTESFICEDGWAKLRGSFAANNLLAFPVDIASERVTYRKTKSGENDSLLSHIRNAFAHGRLSFYTNFGETFVAMEDVDDKRHVSARMIVSKKTMLRWKTIIESGPFMTTEELAAIFSKEET